MLDKKMLDDMPPATVFARGEILDLAIHGEKIRWAARRGGIHDWAIYYGPAYLSWEQVLSQGDKVLSIENIQKLVPCDNTALALYRV